MGSPAGAHSASSWPRLRVTSGSTISASDGSAAASAAMTSALSMCPLLVVTLAMSSKHGSGQEPLPDVDAFRWSSLDCHFPGGRVSVAEFLEQLQQATIDAAAFFDEPLYVVSI